MAIQPYKASASLTVEQRQRLEDEFGESFKRYTGQDVSILDNDIPVEKM